MAAEEQGKLITPRRPSKVSAAKQKQVRALNSSTRSERGGRDKYSDGEERLPQVELIISCRDEGGEKYCTAEAAGQ